MSEMYSFMGVILSLYSWHVTYQLPFMEANMFISFKQKTLVAKVVKMHISKLNTEIINRLRQLYFPSNETADQYREILGCHSQGYACLMGENN